MKNIFSRPPRGARAVLPVLTALAWLVSAGPLRPQANQVRASQPPQAAAADDGQNLFDGKTLAGWVQSGFEGEGAVKVVNPFRDGRGAIVLEPGMTLSGITWTKGSSLPRTNYEITLEAMKLEGEDFFCGLTFPVGKSACTFIVGGWSGTVVGISSVDWVDASENETTRNMEFSDQRWYRIRVRVTDEKIEAWIDTEKMVDFERKGRTFSLRPGDIQKSLPLGIASYMTRAAVRDIRLRLIKKSGPL